MTNLEAINKTLYQLEFIKDFPNQNGIVTSITETLKKHTELKLTVSCIAGFTQAHIKAPWSEGPYVFKGKCNYANQSMNHRAKAIKEALLKAKEHYESQTLSTTDS